MGRLLRAQIFGKRCAAATVFNQYSKQRQTAHERPIEGRIHYSFHPRCGETVLIVRRFAYRGVELVVIPQPDGSSACIPAWMTHEAAARCRKFLLWVPARE